MAIAGKPNFCSIATRLARSGTAEIPSRLFVAQGSEFERDGQKPTVSCSVEAGVKLRGESGPFCIEVSTGWLHCKWLDSLDLTFQHSRCKVRIRTSEHLQVSGTSWSRSVSWKLRTALGTAVRMHSSSLLSEKSRDVYNHMSTSDESGSRPSTVRTRRRRILWDELQCERGSSCHYINSLSNFMNMINTGTVDDR